MSDRDSLPAERCLSLRPRAFRPCFVDERDVGVGGIPPHEQIVVHASGFDGVARKRERSCELQPRQRVYRIDEHDASMVDDPLELGGGLRGLLRCQIREAANVDRIELAEMRIESDPALGEIEAGWRLCSD